MMERQKKAGKRLRLRTSSRGIRPIVLAAAATVGMSSGGLAFAQTVYSYSSGTYQENFGALPTPATTFAPAASTGSFLTSSGSNYSWNITSTSGAFDFTSTSNGLGLSALPGWYGFVDPNTADGGTGIGQFGAQKGDTTKGGVIDFGSYSTTAATPRYLGLLATGTVGNYDGFALELVNSSANTISGFNLDFTGALWRQSNVAKTLSFGYATGTASSTPPVLTSLNAIGVVNFGTLAADTGGVAVDGTAAANQTAVNDNGIAIAGAGWAPGQALWLEWYYNSNLGKAQGIGIGSLSFSANSNAVPVPTDVWTPTLNAGTGAWDIATTQNWTTSGNPSTYSEGDNVQFTDSGVGTSGFCTVNITGAGSFGGVNPTSVSVSNTTGTYQFIGNPITGNASLTKSGAGMLILAPTSGSNGYTGGTSVTGGVLQISADSDLGAVAGQLRLNGGTLALSQAITSARAVFLDANGGTIDTGSNQSSFSGKVFGSGALTQIGSGGIALTGSGSLTSFASGLLTISTDLVVGYTGSTAVLTGATGHALGANVSVTGTANIAAAGTLNLGSGTGGSIGNGTMNFQATGATLTNSGNGTLNGASVLLNSTDPTGASFTKGDVRLNNTSNPNAYIPGSFVTIIGGSTDTNTFSLNAPVSGYSDVLIANGATGGGKGQLIILRPMTYQGTTVIGFNTPTSKVPIVLGVNDGLPVNTDVITGGSSTNGAGIVAGGGTFSSGNMDLAGFNQHIASLSDGDNYAVGGANTAQFDIINSGAGAATFTIAGSRTPANQFSSGNIGGGTASLANINLVKGGTNQIILDNTQTYTGSTTVEGGTLQIGDNHTAAGTGTAGLVSSNIVLAGIDASASSAGTLALIGSSIMPSSSVVTATSSGTFTPGLYLSNGGGAAVAQTISGLLVNGSAGSSTNITVAEANDTLTVGTLTNSVAGVSISGPGAVTITGAQSYGAGSTLSVNGGTLNLNTDAGGNVAVTLASSTTVLNANSVQHLGSLNSAGMSNFTTGSSVIGNVDGTGTVILTGTANLTATHIRQSLLNIGSASTVTIADSANPGNTAATSVLTDLTNSGTIDLQNNDMIITDTSQYAAVKAAIANAYHSGKWDQTGITSSSARANNASYGLGYALASTLGSGSTSFDGQRFSNAVLVKYTLRGDTQLRGTVGGKDYNTVVANYDLAADWSGGNFHNGTTVTGGDYNNVVANYDVTASGSSVSGGGSMTLSAFKSTSSTTSADPTNFVTSDAAPESSVGDMHLEVNTITGDVSLLAESQTALTLYNIFDGSKKLVTANAILISSTNSNWQVVKKTTSILSEGQNQTGYDSGDSTTWDTINLSPGQSIDLGKIFNMLSGAQDLTFEFSEAAGNSSSGDPLSGPDYTGATVDYIPAPEPGSLSLLAVGAVGMLGRRRRRLIARKGAVA